MRVGSQHVIRSVRPSRFHQPITPPARDLLRAIAIWRDAMIVAAGATAALLLVVAFGADLAR